MKKFVKIFAVMLAVLMLGSAMVACDGGDKDAATEAATVTVKTIKVTLEVRDMSRTVYDPYVVELREDEATLDKVIEYFCEDNSLEYEINTNDQLVKIGSVVVNMAKGDYFVAYDTAEGEDSGSFTYFKAHKDKKGEEYVPTVKDGQEIRIVAKR